MMNSSKPFYKTSALDVMTNIAIIVIFILQLVLASLMASLGSSLELSTITNLAWVKGQTELSTESPFLQLMGTWILLLTNFVPISLVVSLELVKFWQAMFM